MPRCEISVVVPTRNRAERLDALLGSLAAQTLAAERFEVVAVDDGSTDRTPELLREAQREGRARVVSGRGAGPAAARNAGWRQARGALVAFTDDDCEADPRWLEHGLRAWRGEPRRFVQGRTAPLPRESARLGPRSRTKSIGRAGPWYQTCNIFYPRALLTELEGFDERFTRPFGEDVDLAWRALERGAEAVFAADALVHHAVEQLGPLAYLRSALRDPDEARIFKEHPLLRARVRRLGFFKSDAHALLALALLALGPVRRPELGAALTAAYAIHLLARCRSMDARAADLPLVALHDTIEMSVAVRGALRHRVALI